MTDTKTMTAPAAAKIEAPKAVTLATKTEAAPAAARKATVRKARKIKARKPRALKARAAVARKTRATKARKTATRTMRAAIDTTTKLNRKGTKIMTNQAEMVAGRVQAVFGDVNQRAKTAIERNSRIAEEMTEMTRGNVEAIVASSKVAAKGIETLGQEVAEYGRKRWEEASAALKTFAAVKSPTELFRLQGEFARTQFDSMIAETSKLSEAMIRIGGDMVQPLAGRATATAERVKSAVSL